MNVTIEPAASIGYLDDLLWGSDQLPKPVSADLLRKIPTHHLRQWCVARAVYQVVTQELLDWLADRIQGKKAIEVCAGHGTIGRHLGIPMSDSYMQTRPEIQAYYLSLRQATISPPSDVTKMDANEHVALAKPEIVIGSWVTQKYIPGEKNGSEFGVREIEIIQLATYIHIGNDGSHGYKQSMKLPHNHQRFPWLFSRGVDQSVNHVGVWEKSN